MYENEEAIRIFLDFMNKKLEDISEIEIVRDDNKGIEYRVVLNGFHNTKDLELCMIRDVNKKSNRRSALLHNVHILKDEPDIRLSKEVKTVYHVAINIPPINEYEEVLLKCLQNLHRKNIPQ